MPIAAPSNGLKHGTRRPIGRPMADGGRLTDKKGRRCVWLAATNGNRGEKKKKKGCGSKRAVANLGMSCERRPSSRKRLGHVISISRGSCSSCPSAAAQQV